MGEWGGGGAKFGFMLNRTYWTAEVGKIRSFAFLQKAQVGSQGRQTAPRRRSKVPEAAPDSNSPSLKPQENILLTCVCDLPGMCRKNAWGEPGNAT